MKANETRVLGNTGLQVTALGMGCASLGGLYAPIDVGTCLATLRTAWDSGLRYFDTAPMYGMGRSEHLLGHFLREEVSNSKEAIISTKVGRLMARARPGRQLPPEAPRNPLDAGWSNGLPFREVFDYSYDGLMRGFDDSLQRTGLGHLDILYVHDIGKVTHGEAEAYHWGALTKGGGFRALEELRAAKLIAGFGLGVNEPEIIHDALQETALDCTLLAGRHSLLEQGALDLLNEAHRAGTAVIIGGVFNSGILAGNAGFQKFNYQDAPEEIIAKVHAIEAVCKEFDVPLGAAAVQYPFRNPAVTTVLVGPNSPERMRANIEWFETTLPDALWRELQEKGLSL